MGAGEKVGGVLKTGCREAAEVETGEGGGRGGEMLGIKQGCRPKKDTLEVA